MGWTRLKPTYLGVGVPNMTLHATLSRIFDRWRLGPALRIGYLKPASLGCFRPLDPRRCDRAPGAFDFMCRLSSAKRVPSISASTNMGILEWATCFYKRDERDLRGGLDQL